MLLMCSLLQCKYIPGGEESGFPLSTLGVVIWKGRMAIFDYCHGPFITWPLPSLPLLSNKNRELLSTRGSSFPVQALILLVFLSSNSSSVHAVYLISFCNVFLEFLTCTHSSNCNIPACTPNFTVMHCYCFQVFLVIPSIRYS
jgi:hypothetical protein